MQPTLWGSTSIAAPPAAKRRGKVAKKESDPLALAPVNVFGNVGCGGGPASHTASSSLLAHGW